MNGERIVMSTSHTAKSDDISAPTSFWRKLGIAGLLFFLIKGLLWLAAPAFFYLVI